MPKIEFDGLPVIEVPDAEEITVAVKPEDMQEGNEAESRAAPDCHCPATRARHR